MAFLRLWGGPVLVSPGEPNALLPVFPRLWGGSVPVCLNGTGGLRILFRLRTDGIPSVPGGFPGSDDFPDSGGLPLFFPRLPGVLPVQDGPQTVPGALPVPDAPPAPDGFPAALIGQDAAAPDGCPGCGGCHGNSEDG